MKTKVLVEFSVDKDLLNIALGNTPNVTAQKALLEFLEGARWTIDDYYYTKDMVEFAIITSD